MKKTNAKIKSNIFGRTVLLICACIFATSTLSAQQAKKRVFATSEISRSTGIVLGGTTSNSSAAIDGNESTFATLNMPIAILGGARYQNLTFDNNVPNGVKVTVKVGIPASLLSVVPNLTVQAFNGTGTSASPIGSAVSLGSLVGTLSVGTGSQKELMLTGNGTWKTVRVTLSGLNVLSAADVYEAYYEEDESVNINCDQFKAYDVVSGVTFAAGATAPILDISGAVLNPLNMIDGDETTYAELNRSVLSAAGSVYAQTAFRSNYAAGDKIRVLIGSSNDLIDLNVLSAITFTTYLDDEVKETFSLDESFIRLDILSQGDLRWIEIKTTQEFNRAEIRINSTVDVGLFTFLRIYEMFKVPAGPSISVNSQNTTIYSGQTAQLEATASGPDDVINWYKEGTTELEGTGSSFTTPALTETTKYDVLSSRFNCLNNPSDVTVVTVNVLKVLTPQPADGIVNVGYTGDILVEGPDATGRTYNYVINQGSLPDGLTLNVDGTISGTPTTPGSAIFLVDITDITDPGNPLIVGTFSYTLNVTTILPVTLQYFRAEVKLDNVLLTWKTASEQSNKEFVIERNIDSKGWVTIGVIKSKAVNGNSSFANEYSFTDNTVKKGVHLYRLKQVDLNGNFSYSNIEKVEFKDLMRIVIYPNPGVDLFYIDGIEKGSQIKVMDAAGKVILSRVAKNQNFKLNLEKVTKGLYFIVIKDKANQITKHTIIKK